MQYPGSHVTLYTVFLRGYWRLGTRTRIDVERTDHGKPVARILRGRSLFLRRGAPAKIFSVINYSLERVNWIKRQRGYSRSRTVHATRKLAVLLQSSTLVTAICGVKSSQYSNFWRLQADRWVAWAVRPNPPNPPCLRACTVNTQPPAVWLRRARTLRPLIWSVLSTWAMYSWYYQYCYANCSLQLAVVYRVCNVLTT